MARKLPPELIKEFERANRLHEQAVCDHENAGNSAKVYLNF